MYVTPDRFAASSKAGVEAGLALAEAQFAVIERLAALNMRAAKAAIEDSAAHVKAVLEAKDPQEIVKLNSAFTQPALEKLAAYGRSVYDVAFESQAQASKVVESQAAEFNKAVASTLDSFAKNAPAGSDVAVNAAKSAWAAFNSAYDTVQKATKQATEVVEANFANATSAKAKRR